MDSVVKKISYSFNYKSSGIDVRDILDKLSSSVSPEITLYAAQVKGPMGESIQELPVDLPLILGKSGNDDIVIKISGRQLSVEKKLGLDDNLSTVLQRIRDIADALVDVLKNNIDQFLINFCGIVSEGFIETEENATTLLKNNFFKRDILKNDPFDLRIRFTYSLRDTYFVNLLLSNARTDKDLNNRISFGVDTNTRYLYNYGKNHPFEKKYEDDLVDLVNSMLLTGISNFISGGDLYDAREFNDNSL